MPVDLPPELKQRIFRSMQAFCREHLECDPGLLQTERLYDFVVQVVGAAVYNQAVTDAQAWMQRRLIDLEGDLHATIELAPAR